MEVYEPPGPTQDYDIPPSNRGTLDLPGPSVSLDYNRRGSHDSQRSGLGSRPGSRKASLANDLYDTPPSSKRTSGDINSNASGIYDTPPSSKRASSERTPPPSNRSSSASASNTLINHLSSSSSPLHHLNLPPALQQRRRSGGSGHSSDNCYETPPGSNRSSLERILSEEGPPIYESLSLGSSTDRLAGDVCEEPTYDTPPNRNQSQVRPHNPLGQFTSQSSLHSAPSIESLLSNTSGVSSSHNASLPDSARSSMDLPADTYDVPPSSLHGGEVSRKQHSTDSGLGFYDSPVKSRPCSSTSGSNVSLTSSNGTLKSSLSPLNPKPISPSLAKDIKRSRSLEHALHDFYDTPKNNSPKLDSKTLGSGISEESGSVGCLNDQTSVYDIPPQVTRDSVISATSESSSEDNRFSSSSIDLQCNIEAPVWDMPPLDLDSALELLLKKQQNVSKATSRLAVFINDGWRTRTSLEKTLYDIKVACSLVKTSLQEFVEFSLKALSNAIRLPDHQLAAKLQKQISPLQSMLEFVNKSFQNLEDTKWQVTLLSEPLSKNKSDDLGQIALVAKDLLQEVKRVASYIHSHGPVLFKKSSDYRNLSLTSKPPKGPYDGYGTLKQKDIQHRPLPAVPGSANEKELPSTSLTLKQTLPLSKLSLYDIKSALHQDDYAECDALPSPEQSYNSEMKQSTQEYDYVELDSRDFTTGDDAIKAENVLLDLRTYSDTDTLKSHRNDTDLEQKTKTHLEAGHSILIETNTIKDSPLNEEKTPSSKTWTTKSRLDGIEPSSVLDREEEISEKDLKTPVNLGDYASCSSQESSFVLPDTDLPAFQKPLNEVVDEALDPSDRQVLIYYSEQMTSHATLLANATDAFLGVVADGQPPNVFISHSKFLIVSAHKLVHIGDSIHRNLASNTISTNIMHCANNLCDCLKASVTATKTAALQYPSGPALQEMVDRVMDVSHAAHELRLIIKQAIK